MQQKKFFMLIQYFCTAPAERQTRISGDIHTYGMRIGLTRNIYYEKEKKMADYRLTHIR